MSVGSPPLLKAISNPSAKVSPSVSTMLGSVPVSPSPAKVPVLVSTLSFKPSLSESTATGLVPVWVALTQTPVPSSTPSSRVSSSESSSVGSSVGKVAVVTAKSNSSRSVRPSPSKSPVPAPGPGPVARPLSCVKSPRKKFSSKLSAIPSPSLSIAAVGVTAVRVSAATLT